MPIKNNFFHFIKCWNDSHEKSNSNKLSLNNEALALSPSLAAKRVSRYSGMLNGSFLINLNKSTTGRSSISRLNEKLIETQNKKIPTNIFAGAVVTSSRLSRRRISNTEATKAFAVATSGSTTPQNLTSQDKPASHRNSAFENLNCKIPGSSFSGPSMVGNSISGPSNRMSVVSSGFTKSIYFSILNLTYVC